jgi:excinuclease ABC subunit B
VDTIRDEDLLPKELDERMQELESQMRGLAKELRYEEAAKLRDRLRVLEIRKLAIL